MVFDITEAPLCDYPIKFPIRIYNMFLCKYSMLYIFTYKLKNKYKGRYALINKK